MNEPFRLRTIAACAILLLLMIFGARLIGRELAAPFNGLDRLARFDVPPAPPEEIEFPDAIRAIDWDAPAAAPAPKAKSKPALAPLTAAAEMSAPVLLTRIAAEVKLYFGQEEPDLETMAASLGLSDAQKSRVSGLLEWRTWSLDALAVIEADQESKDLVNEMFRDAVKGLLDEAQRGKYEASRSSQLGVFVLRSGNRTESHAMKTVLQELAKPREK
jgi:hypothetical protein